MIEAAEGPVIQYDELEYQWLHCLHLTLPDFFDRILRLHFTGIAPSLEEIIILHMNITRENLHYARDIGANSNLMSEVHSGPIMALFTNLNEFFVQKTFYPFPEITKLVDVLTHRIQLSERLQILNNINEFISASSRNGQFFQLVTGNLHPEDIAQSSIWRILTSENSTRNYYDIFTSLAQNMTGFGEWFKTLNIELTSVEPLEEKLAFVLEAFRNKLGEVDPSIVLKGYRLDLFRFFETIIEDIDIDDIEYKYNSFIYRLLIGCTDSDDCVQARHFLSRCENDPRLLQMLVENDISPEDVYRSPLWSFLFIEPYSAAEFVSAMKRKGFLTPQQFTQLTDNLLQPDIDIQQVAIDLSS